MEPNLSLCQLNHYNQNIHNQLNNVQPHQLEQNGIWPTSTSSICAGIANYARSQQENAATATNQEQQFYYTPTSQDPLTHLMKPLPLSALSLNHVIGPLETVEANLDYAIQGYWAKSGDERTSRLPLMAGGPWKLLCATIIYLYLIKWFLPRLMARRSNPLELQWLIRAYNLFMVCANMYAFYHGLRILDYGRKCFGCKQHSNDMAKDKSAQAWELLHYGWLFMLSRLVEWVDTVFFVLRKRQRQVTKLHVFHHSFVPLLSWFYLKFYPDVTMAFFPLVNTLVHTVMYAYYFLATFGPKLQPYLWWKKYLTSMQIAQFVAILIQLASIPLSGDPACQYPRSFLLGAVSGASLFLFLFYAYYKDTYRTTSSQNQSRVRANLDEPSKVSKSRDGTSRALSELVDDSILKPDQQQQQHKSKYIHTNGAWSNKVKMY